MKRHWTGAFALVIGALTAFAGQVRAQPQGNWPTRPVRIIVPYAAGGSTDNATRPFTERLSTALGQQFVIENKGGASGVLGTEAGVKSAPDGYTFFVVPAAVAAVLPHARKMPFDPFKDMVPVSRFAENTLTFSIHPSIPATNMKEFVAYAKQNPGKLSFGSPGLGSLTHLICESVRFEAGIDILHIPYRGGAEALTDFLAGHVQIFCEGNLLPNAKIGKARVLAVADNERHPDFPDAPMLKEIWPAADAVSWGGLFAPTGTPDAIVRRLSEELQKIAADPALKAQMLRVAIRPVVSSPEELTAMLRKDYDRYAKMVKELNIRMD